MIQTQFNLPIKSLRTDHGGEFTSHDFTTYLLHHGIHHQFSCPYTPEQNGVAERKNRHLLETARTLLHHASLPLQFWLEATSTATYLINRLPTKTLYMQSPYQKLYQKPPSFSHLRTFGCLCYPWTAYSRITKLDPKSSPCIFIGYPSDHKGFRCLDPSISKIIISRHIRFHEHEFPMAKPPPIIPSPHLSTHHNPIPHSSLPLPYRKPSPLPHPTGPLHLHPHPRLSPPAKSTPTSNTNAGDPPPLSPAPPHPSQFPHTSNPTTLHLPPLP